MQKQKVDKTNFFTLLVFLKMLNKTRETLNFRTVGKWSERTCAKAYSNQYGSEAMKHCANIEKKTPSAKPFEYRSPQKLTVTAFFLRTLNGIRRIAF